MFIWTIYHQPIWSDSPWVCAEWVLEVNDAGKPIAVPYVHETASLAEARAIVPKGRVWQKRQDTDEPAHVETWL